MIKFVRVTVEHKLSALTKYLKLLTQTNWYLKLFSKLCKNSVTILLVMNPYLSIPRRNLFLKTFLSHWDGCHRKGNFISFLLYRNMFFFLTNILLHKKKKNKSSRAVFISHRRLMTTELGNADLEHFYHLSKFSWIGLVRVCHEYEFVFLPRIIDWGWEEGEI